MPNRKLRYDYDTMKAYMKAYRDKRQREAIEYLGGECIRCGQTESLEFDHKDPSTKYKPVTTLLQNSKELFWTEVKKCQLLCHNCHVKKTNEDRYGIIEGEEAKCGTHRKYRSGCKCNECKEYNNKFSRENKRRKRLEKQGMVPESGLSELS